MLNYNKVIFGGHVTADPIVKPVGSSSVANFTVAANYRRKKADGTPIDEVCFLEVEAWGAKADIAARFLKKGSQVMVEGRLKQSNWDDKNGNKRSKLSLNCEEIILMGAPTGGDSDNKSIAVARTVATIKGAGFEVTKVTRDGVTRDGVDNRRIDDAATKVKEEIDD